MNALPAFMQNMIDYAGLFPPAKLPMADAVANYAAYRMGPHVDTLGRFICPASRLGEFAECAAEYLGPDASDMPWMIAVLGRGGDDAATSLANFQFDLADMRVLAQRFELRCQIDVLETRVPVLLIEAGDAPGITAWAERMEVQAIAGAPQPIAPYYEVAFVGDWRHHVPDAIAGLAAHNHRRNGAEHRCCACAVKMRTGGVEAPMFPSVDEVTTVIDTCLREKIAFKATAGLHHPVRHFADSVGTKMHGFLNVFGAAILTHAHDLDVATLACIVEDEAPEHFKFEAGRFIWQTIEASAAQIAAARLEFAHGFGSCSFDEPLDDLRAWGWI